MATLSLYLEMALGLEIRELGGGFDAIKKDEVVVVEVVVVEAVVVAVVVLVVAVAVVVVVEVGDVKMVGNWNWSKSNSVNSGGRLVVVSVAVAVDVTAGVELGGGGGLRRPVWFGRVVRGEAEVGCWPPTVAEEDTIRCFGVIFTSGWKNLKYENPLKRKFGKTVDQIPEMGQLLEVKVTFGKQLRKFFISECVSLAGGETNIPHMLYSVLYKQTFLFEWGKDGTNKLLNKFFICQTNSVADEINAKCVTWFGKSDSSHSLQICNAFNFEVK